MLRIPPGPRTTFRPGDVVRAADLCAAFEQVEASTRRHLAIVHGAWGIVSGLEVRPGESGFVVIAPGAALDALGRWLTVSRPFVVALPPARAILRWRLVIEAGVSPRFVPDPEAGPPGLALELACWDGRALQFGERRAAQGLGARALPRVASGQVARGAAWAVERPDRNGWTARIELGESNLSGAVAALAWPAASLGQLPAGASWSITRLGPESLTFEAVNWPLPVDDGKQSKAMVTPVALGWIAVELVETLESGFGAQAMSRDTTPAESLSQALVPQAVQFKSGSTLSAASLNQSLQRLFSLHTLHNQFLHAWGIVHGLSVSVTSDAKALVVQPGLALGRNGLESYVSVPTPIAIPPDAVTAGSVTRWLAIAPPSDLAVGTGEAAIAWRNPNARTAIDRFAEDWEILLAEVVFSGGKVESVDGSKRRVVRPRESSSPRGGITPEEGTEWRLWPSPPRGRYSETDSPRGVSTRIEWPGGAVPPGAVPLVLAQLVGTRYREGSVLAGSSFVDPESIDDQGFEFVVAFPDPKLGPGVWGAKTQAEMFCLLEELRLVHHWRVSWLAIIPEV